MKKLSGIIVVLLIALLACSLTACGDETPEDYAFTINSCEGVLIAEFDEVNTADDGTTRLATKGATLNIFLVENYSGENMVVRINGTPVEVTQVAEDTTGRSYKCTYKPTADFTVEISGVERVG